MIVSTENRFTKLPTWESPRMVNQEANPCADPNAEKNRGSTWCFSLVWTHQMTKFQVFIHHPNRGTWDGLKNPAWRHGIQRSTNVVLWPCSGFGNIISLRNWHITQCPPHERSALALGCAILWSLEDSFCSTVSVNFVKAKWDHQEREVLSRQTLVRFWAIVCTSHDHMTTFEFDNHYFLPPSSEAEGVSYHLIMPLSMTIMKV